MIITIVLLAGCSKDDSSSSGSASQTAAAASDERNYTLKFQHLGVEGDAYDLGAKRFKELAEEYSGGSLTIELYSNGELASGANAVQSVQMGTLDIVAESSMTEANFIPSFDVLNLPFLFDNLDQVWTVLDGQVGEELKADAEASGFKVLCFWDNGFRNVSNNTRAINSVDDVAGLKIRVPENGVFVDTWEALGAIPTPMAWSEVYSALQLGTIDGQENPNGHMQSYNLTEIQKYFAITNHVYTAEPVIMNLSVFNKLSDNQKEALMKAAAESATYEREQRRMINDETLQWISDQGVEITYPDIESFRDKVAPIYEEYGAKYSNLLSEIQEVTGK